MTDFPVPAPPTMQMFLTSSTAMWMTRLWSSSSASCRSLGPWPPWLGFAIHGLGSLAYSFCTDSGIGVLLCESFNPVVGDVKSESGALPCASRAPVGGGEESRALSRVLFPDLALKAVKKPLEASCIAEFLEIMLLLILRPTPPADASSVLLSLLSSHARFRCAGAGISTNGSNGLASKFCVSLDGVAGSGVLP
jgi:hypothetical protein